MTDLPSEPRAEPPTVPPLPFSPGRPAAPSGCGRYALIGCGFSALLLGIAAVVFLFKAGDLFAWTLQKMEAQIATQLPADLAPEERDRLHAAFEGVRVAVQRREIDAAALQRLQTKLGATAGRPSGTRMEREEYFALIAALEAVPARPEPTAAPAPPAD